MITAPAVVSVNEISLASAREIVTAGIESAVGHQETAALFTAQLGITVALARSTVSLIEETALVGQYVGPRLAEGSKELPPGATIKWFLVTVS